MQLFFLWADFVCEEYPFYLMGVKDISGFFCVFVVYSQLGIPLASMCVRSGLFLGVLVCNLCKTEDVEK